MKSFFYFGILFWGVGLFAQSPDYDKKLDSLYDRGYDYMYTDKYSSDDSFDEMYKLASINKDWNSASDALMGKITAADYHNDLSVVKINIDKLDSLFLQQKGYFDENPETILYINLFNYHKGNYYYHLNDYNKSRAIFNKIIDRTEKLPDSMFKGNYMGNVSYLSLAHSFIGKMLSEEGKLDLALDHYERDIRYINDTNNKNQERLYNNFGLIAEVLKKKREYEKANSYLLKILDYNISNKNKYSIAIVLNIVQNHNYLAQIDSSEYYLKIAENLLDDNDPSLSSYYQVSAETYQTKGNYVKAVQEFGKALQLVRQKWEGKKHWEIAHVLNKIGQLHSEFGHPQKAIESFNLAMEQLSGSNTALNQRKIVQILKHKAQVLNQIKTKPEYLKAVSSVDIGIATLDSLKPSFKTHADKLLLIEDSFPLFESGLEATFNLYSATKNAKYIDRAFHYSEKSKSVLLQEALLASKATDFANIPEPLLERESQLKSEIIFVEKELNTSKTGAGKLEDELFDLKSEYRQLVEDVESDYKTYYDLKYNTAVVSLKEVQEKLKEDEKLISYFYGSDALYVIGTGKNGKQFEKIPIDSLFEARIRNIQKMLSNPKSDMDVLAKASHGLYQTVLEPFLNSNDPTKLTIIADGLLNYIPFGALNTADSGTSYLVEKHSVSYASSVTLREQLSEETPNNTDVLAFAPSFDGTAEIRTDRSKLLPLPHNKKEVAQVLQFFSGKSFLDDSATLENFKAELYNFGVLHFATHAIFDDALPEYSYLAFSQKGGEIGDDVLFTADLYNLKIDAALVTLSACETNIGELRKGEGFLSLARGFFYSGAKSIASTLWKVNDASSSEVMGEFYRQLSEGKSKDEALRKAELLFLKHNDQNARNHPYYWAGYVVSGNMTPIKQDEPIWAWLLGGALLITGAAVGYAYRKKSA